MPQTPVIHQPESEVERTTNDLQKIHDRLAKIEEEVASIKQTAQKKEY